MKENELNLKDESIFNQYLEENIKELNDRIQKLQNEIFYLIFNNIPEDKMNGSIDVPVVKRENSDFEVLKTQKGKICQEIRNIQKQITVSSILSKSEIFSLKQKKESLEIRHIELANKLFGLVVITYDESKNCFTKEESYLNETLSKIGYIVKQIENKSEIKYITDKKRELEEFIKLEAMKVEFLSNMSHEFRTPINIILAIVQLLNLHNKPLGDEKYKEYLNILKQNSYRLLRLVNNVMDITKVNSDSDKLNLVNCNIVSVLEEIVMSTVLYASEKKRNIIFDTDSEEIILACDEDKIERIMLNLISNAIKFSQLHTDIEIKIKRNVDLNRVYISVKNYGSNIEFNDREKIFERFHRVDNSLNRKNEGCGIGLFLCRKFIEMHGGEIFLDNITLENLSDIMGLEVVPCLNEGKDFIDKILK